MVRLVKNVSMMVMVKAIFHFIVKKKPTIMHHYHRYPLSLKLGTTQVKESYRKSPVVNKLSRKARDLSLHAISFIVPRECTKYGTPAH